MIETELTEMFGAEFPIINAGMGEAAYGDLAGAVAATGGIGAIGTTTLTPEGLASEIERARDWLDGDGPIIVDIPFTEHAVDSDRKIPVPDKRPKPIDILESEIENKGATIKEYNELGGGLDLFNQEKSKKLLDVALDKQVDAIVPAMGVPEWLVEQCHEANVKVIGIAGRPRHAEKAEQAGADMVIADGSEGGGHSGPISTLELVPMVSEQVDIPVIAGGGIVNGSQIAASLAMGAVGVWMGTLFLITEESGADTHLKRQVMERNEDNPTIKTSAYDGFPIRMLKNRYTEIWEEYEDEILDYPEQMILSEPLKEAAIEYNLNEYKHLLAGEGTPLIDENKFPKVNYLMADLVTEMEEALTNVESMKK
jgi:NAD(P)H-dependent flavin oxidoreductase YrpB (nitropropane dioxygenase family)